MFKVNNKATKTTPWRRFGGFIVNFEHTSHLCSSVSIVNFEHVNVGWVMNGTFPVTKCLFEFKSKKTELTYNAQKSFSLGISSVNATESAVSCRFGCIYRRDPKWKTSSFAQFQFF